MKKKTLNAAFLIGSLAFAVLLAGMKYEFFKDKKSREGVKKELQALKNDVTLLVFTSEKPECAYCGLTRQIVKELASLSPRIKPGYFDIDKDKKNAGRHGIDKVPAIIVTRGENKNIRFFGVPGGYEFNSLLETLKNVSSGGPALSLANEKKIKSVKEKILIRVFVTPTCPYCPPAVVTAHRIALANPVITADMVEATEFPELSRENNVSSVPKTVITDSRGRKKELIGAHPEDDVVAAVLSMIK